MIENVALMIMNVVQMIENVALTFIIYNKVKIKLNKVFSVGSASVIYLYFFNSKIRA